MKPDTKNRETLTDIFRVSRFFILPIALALIWALVTQMVEMPTARFKTIIILFFLFALYRLIYHIRHIQYDHDMLYLIYGQQEKAIPFSNIVSICETGRQFFGARNWILTYKDTHYKKQNCRYFTRLTHEKMRTFLNGVHRVNPNVAITELGSTE